MPAHFSRSAVRRKDFLQLQDIMEADNQEDTCHPFKKYMETRWLVRAHVIRSICKNWDTLSAYFSSIKDIRMEQKIEVQKLADIFKDKSKYALLAFLLPIVEQFERLNAMFQGTGGAEKAYEALQRSYKCHDIWTCG